MFWRKVITGLLFGALLGFMGQFAIDSLVWPLSAEDHFGICEYVFARNFCGWLKRIEPERVEQTRMLLLRALLLHWLQERGELAGRTAMMVAFLGVSSVLAADHLRQRRQSKKAATVS